ncbi:MAG: WG repeat-containing protein [Abditibacteriota bacterium]|nr:WG repeat-containing protein [Abditibacteriota bacterium]
MHCALLILLSLSVYAQKGPVKHLKPDETFQPGRFATESKAKLPPEEDYIMAVKTTGKNYTEVIFTYNEIKYPLFDAVTPLENNLVSTEKNNKYGLITDQGKILVSAKYPYRIINTIGDFLLVTDHNKQGIMDRDQNIIVPIEYDKLQIAGDDLILGVLGNRGTFLDFKGNKKFEKAISEITLLPESSGFIGKEGENYYVFDLSGALKSKPYSNITLQNNLLICENVGECEVLNSNLKTIFSTKDKGELWNITDKGFEVKKGDFFGFWDLEGKNIFLPQFKEIYIIHSKGGYAVAVSENKSSIYDFSAKTYSALDHEFDIFNSKDQKLFY